MFNKLILLIYNYDPSEFNYEDINNENVTEEEGDSKSHTSTDKSYNFSEEIFSENICENISCSD